MASAQENGNTSAHDHAANGAQERKPYDYGGNPLAHVRTDGSVALPAFGGDFQPGLYKRNRKLANPAPLGLSAFALTTFVLSLINVTTLNITEPNIVVAIAYGYGGLVQLLAGMWEVACGNTFGATALASYGGFWISFGIILTPGGFNIVNTLEGVTETGGMAMTPEKFTNSFALYLFGWFIFTFLLLICTLKSTVAFFSLFFTLDLAFLMLGLGYLYADAGTPKQSLITAGGAFGLAAALLAWYNALAGIADNTNSFFVIPVAHFPWSEKGREKRGKVDNSAERAAQDV
ncbi:hypothetical protein EJ05DRAFT_478884 [Pseudovirgaria hyperparasitica]|uniref:Acetate permease A n=1 Tax=Pseudovirgaria hyperparasitica TaxID=470096 RepID=A0A6A6VY12_9PEZI|nr:uncharacterized protein EJ05DRAFT_478884 [Pseudovirgaria hyperparasitica]KAF2755075.1 hypothetical protein EJ05DRAFT_478884 [Pseudovirgaria hyperparasitica]